MIILHIIIHKSNSLCLISSTITYIHKMYEKNLSYNLENLKSYNSLDKASLWYVGLVKFVRLLSGFHCFMGCFKNIRDSGCFSTLLLE